MELIILLNYGMHILVALSWVAIGLRSILWLHGLLDKDPVLRIGVSRPWVWITVSGPNRGKYSGVYNADAVGAVSTCGIRGYLWDNRTLSFGNNTSGR